MNKSLIFVALLATGAHAQQIHRCTIDGKTVIQQLPCPGATPPRQEPSIKPAAPQLRAAPQPRPPIGDPEYEARRAEQIRADLLKWREEAAQANLERQRQEQVQRQAEFARCPGGAGQDPIPGVTKTWVETCSTWGRPSRRTTLTTALGSSETWQYERGSLTFGPDGHLRTIISTR